MPRTDPVFEEHRPGLARLAYRMLGSLADADDVMQEAYLRWSREDRAAVLSPKSYLYSVVTRLCIDQRRAAEARRTEYVGLWLPEPVVEPPGSAEVAEAVSLALLVVLESLSPVERAAYLLRRVFEFDYGDIAHLLEKTEANCRQLVSRAEEHVKSRRPRFEPEPGEADRLTDAFLQACSTGDLEGLKGMLARDAVFYSDGGGKVPAALAPVHGSDYIARLFLGLARKTPGLEACRARVNGQPGILLKLGGRLDTVLTFDVADGRIQACYAVRNPDKLGQVRVPSDPH